MNVRFKMTNQDDVAILPRKEFEPLAAKAREADEDIGTARLVARAEGDRSWDRGLFRKKLWPEFAPAKMHCAWFASGAVRHSFISRKRLTSAKAIFRIWRADGERQHRSLEENCGGAQGSPWPHRIMNGLERDQRWLSIFSRAALAKEAERV
jgi:hypothetical protein